MPEGEIRTHSGINVRWHNDLKKCRLWGAPKSLPVDAPRNVFWYIVLPDFITLLFLDRSTGRWPRKILVARVSAQLLLSPWHWSLLEITHPEIFHWLDGFRYVCIRCVFKTSLLLSSKISPSFAPLFWNVIRECYLEFVYNWCYVLSFWWVLDMY